MHTWRAIVLNAHVARQGEEFDWVLFRLAGTMSLKAVQKFALEKGETLVLLRSFDSTAWGMYSIVQNLGSLAVRLFFLPVEDMAQLAFSKLISSRDSAAAARVLGSRPIHHTRTAGTSAFPPGLPRRELLECSRRPRADRDPHRRHRRGIWAGLRLHRHPHRVWQGVVADGDAPGALVVRGACAGARAERRLGGARCRISSRFYLCFLDSFCSNALPASLSLSSLLLSSLRLQAFVHASATPSQMARRGILLLPVTAGYLAVAAALAPVLGVRALILANALNMLLRTFAPSTRSGLIAAGSSEAAEPCLKSLATAGA